MTIAQSTRYQWTALETALTVHSGSMLIIWILMALSTLSIVVGAVTVFGGGRSAVTGPPRSHEHPTVVR